MTSEETTNINVIPADKAKIAKIWKTAGILAAVTAVEFLIAFTVANGLFRISVFIGLTIVKAFYIVAEFMHLKHEVKVLIWSILIPMLFVVWLLVALIYEGGAILDLRS